MHLIGRSGEMGELERVWRRVCEGGGPAGVLVQGPAGVGKSRLIEQATTALVGPREVLMLGRCVDLYGTAMPYGGASDAVRDLIRRHGVEPARAWSGRFATALASLIRDIDPEVTEVAPGSLLEGFATLLDNAAAARPVWLWIEDLHWSDVGTRALVSYVMRTVRAPRLMVTCTLRTHEPAPSYDVLEFWSELRRLPHVSAVELQPFSRLEVAEHWDALEGGPASAREVDRVLELSGGLPFYTELLAGSGWTVERPVPPTLRELAASPMARLSANARFVVEAASVENGRLPHGVIRDVVGTGADVDSALAEAVAAGVLTLEEGGAGYRFRHALIREAVAASLLPPARSRWHARWAARLDEAGTSEMEPFAQIAAAHHWVQADDPTRAFDAALAAAELASRIVALDEEAQLLCEALELWPRVAQPETRTGYTRDDLLRSVVVVLAFLPDPPALQRVISRELAGPGGDPVRDVVLRDFRRRFRDGGEGAGDGVADRAAADLLLATPLEHPWLTRAAVEVSYQFESEAPAVSERLTQRALASARLLAGRTSGPTAYLPMTPAVDVAVASCVVAGLCTATGDVEQAAHILATAPRDVGERQIASHADWYLAETLWMLGRHREAIEATEHALERIVEPHRAPLLWGGVMVQQAEAQLALGRWEDAERTLARCGQVLTDDAAICQALALTGLLACWRGRPDEAAVLLERVEAAPGPDPVPADVVRTRWLTAQLAASRHDLAGLRQALDSLWLQDRWHVASDYVWQPLLFELRVEVDLLLLPSADGERVEARRRVELCRGVAERLHRTGDTGVAWDLHLQAELELVAGSAEPSAWDEVCAAWDRVGRVHDRAWARLRQSACLASRKQREEALALVEEVRRTATDLGAFPLDDAARALATRVRSGGRRRRDAPAGLTRREEEVLRLLALGHSNAQIAEELFISTKTVSIHASAVLAKLHAASRTAAVATAQRSGILPIPDGVRNPAER